MSTPKKTSQLLIDEVPLQVLPSLAAKIGLNRAVFLQQLHYWLKRPGAHERDGRRWIYNTAQEWHEQFPFWSPEAIRKIVAQLRKAGLIETTSSYNQHRSDKTLWYTINYEALEELVGGSEDPPEKSTQTLDPPEKSTERPEKSTDLGPDKSWERYQRLPETNNRDSDLQSGEAAISPPPAPEKKVMSPKQYAIGRLMDFYNEAREKGKKPAVPDEPFKRRNGDIYAAHFAEGYEAKELDEALRVQVRHACGEGEGYYEGKKRWIPFVDALEIARREKRTPAAAERAAPSPEFPPSPPEAIEAIRNHAYLCRYAPVAERWDFTSAEEPPFKILARIGGDEEERWRNLERLRSVARRAVREKVA
ncbi:hypothetical protein [Rubrobacter calidifluminis]|uniref:hypothetical protein n=1 Tax=Rubrobacter calidifluminis TaxID=1392640 RepID=UPI002360F380|nr:hypothetical protein [Rubrobacter calidifluminis]